MNSSGSNWKKNILKVVLSRTFLFALLALLQVALFVVLTILFAATGTVAYYVLTLVTVLVVTAILEQDDVNPAYKLMWLLIIVLLPAAGTLFYLLWGHNYVPKRHRERLKEIDGRANAAVKPDESSFAKLNAWDEPLSNGARYLVDYAHSPVYPAEGVEYYPLGEDFFPRFLDSIRAAKNFVFMQYYIYEEGVMLDTALEILRQKVAEGVDVRILWDGFGSLFTLPPDFDKKLKSYGIRCAPFNMINFTFRISEYGMLNHRDHRKIAVVDGEVAFTGGLNFADEYINVKQRFGEWKDTAVMVKGEAACSLTTVFLRAWDFATGDRSDFAAYRPCRVAPPKTPDYADGFVQPYWDSPLDKETVSENAYFNVIRQACRYLYISTPYLIVDYEMIMSLTLAAKSGIDVRILTPGIPDKPKVFLVTQSYYRALLAGGVRIFEYTPGFNHAKMYVSDDKVAIVGSANMDFRSLYLHFENCTAFYGGHVVGKVKEDMLACFAKAREVTLDDVKNMPLWKRLLQTVLRFFSPMM